MTTFSRGKLASGDWVVFRRSYEEVVKAVERRSGSVMLYGELEADRNRTIWINPRHITFVAAHNATERYST